MKNSKELNVVEIEKKIGYTFKDKSLLTQAFTRTSYCNEINPTVKTKYHSNEVLEFFGDGVLSLSIITFLLKECTERYEHGIRTELGEGDFSNIKSKLSDKQNLSKSMKALGLEKHLLMGEGDYKLGIQNEPSVMEDLFESIVGAIFIDSDMSIGAVIKAVSGMLDMSVYTSREKISQSAKNALQEWCADKKRRLPPPRYETLSEDGPDHKKTYVRGCYIGDKLMGRGIGKNFKIADSEAAEDALKALMAQSGAITKATEAKEAPKSKESVAKQQDAKKEAKKPEENPVNEDNTPIPVVKISDVVKTNGIKKVGASIALKNYAISNKKPNPTFRDLGEKRIGSKIECSVECSFIGETTLGTGATRLEAREVACQLMAEKIGIGAKKKQSQKSAKKAQAESKTETKSEAKPEAKTNAKAKPEVKATAEFKPEQPTAKAHPNEAAKSTTAKKKKPSGYKPKSKHHAHKAKKPAQG